jgi:RecA-family ATPase
MTQIKEVHLPKSEEGNDPNDNREDPNYINKVKGNSCPLNSFVLNGESEKMKEQMLEDKYILGRMAILGQITVMYAKPGAGKTLITMWLLIKSIKEKNINPGDVYYVNADDTHKGLTYKLSLAEQYGFQMLAPGYNGFKAEMLSVALEEMVKNDTARGKIIILDTLKKFTDIMNKTAATKFTDISRQFGSKGGSVIMLAHVNKHTDSEGKVIYSGTSDIVDDADCCYTLEVIEEEGDTKVVEFINLKDRGDVVKKAQFSYSNEVGKTYKELLDSVKELDSEESSQIAERIATRGRQDKNCTVIEAITMAINNGCNTKTELVKTVQEETGKSKNQIIKVLDDHTGTDPQKGRLWSLKIGDKNCHIYKLNTAIDTRG